MRIMRLLRFKCVFMKSVRFGEKSHCISKHACVFLKRCFFFIPLVVNNNNIIEIKEAYACLHIVITLSNSLGKSLPSLRPSRLLMNCWQDIFFPIFCNTITQYHVTTIMTYMSVSIILSMTETTDPLLSYPSKLLPSKTRVYRLIEYYSSNKGRNAL